MDKKILLVYYSRTGTTRKVAEYIRQLIDCDTEEIIDKKDRSGMLGYLFAGRDAAFKRLTEIQETKLNPGNYEILIIGTPVRDFTMSSAIRTYIQKNKANLPSKIIFYCTMGGCGNEKTFRNMTYLCGKTPIGAIRFKTRDIIKNQFQDRLKKFLEDIITS